MMVEMMKINDLKAQTCNVEGIQAQTYNITEQLAVYTMVFIKSQSKEPCKEI
jgi:hypothetical protein